MSVDVADVQGNVLRSYGQSFDHARHVVLGIGGAAAGRAFLGELVDGRRGDGLEVASAADWREKPASRLNVAITWPGLQRLGVDDAVLAAFPPAFRDGPAVRAAVQDGDGVGLGDVGSSAPERWIVGGPRNPEVHLVVSVHARSPERLDEVSRHLEAAVAAHGLVEHSRHDARALPNGRVHFGYRDGISQPRIEDGLGKQHDDLQPEMPAGDLLLGAGHESSFGGNWAGDLPAALADDGTYGVFRILRQDVAGFEALLADWGRAAGMDPELVAAKLMGRWRNGVPLALSPETPHPDPPLPPGTINAFDYAPVDGRPELDDPDGLRCPVGAHVRRLNPRGSLVMGKPYSRRLVRRNMPYGPEFDPARPDTEERGLVGFFLCGDIETQWEFIQRVWVNEGIATHGIRGTREPFTGAQPDGGGSFTIPTAPGDRVQLSRLPTLVDTRGSAYCLLPGIGGLRHLANGAAA